MPMFDRRLGGSPATSLGRLTGTSRQVISTVPSRPRPSCPWRAWGCRPRRARWWLGRSGTFLPTRSEPVGCWPSTVGTVALDDADYEAAAARVRTGTRDRPPARRSIPRGASARQLVVRRLAGTCVGRNAWSTVERQSHWCVDGRDDYGAFVAHAQALRASMLFAEHREALAYAAATLRTRRTPARCLSAWSRTCAEYANVYMAVGDWDRARAVARSRPRSRPAQWLRGSELFPSNPRSAMPTAVARHLERMEVSARVVAPHMVQHLGGAGGIQRAGRLVQRWRGPP